MLARTANGAGLRSIRRVGVCARADGPKRPRPTSARRRAYHAPFRDVIEGRRRYRRAGNAPETSRKRSVGCAEAPRYPRRTRHELEFRVLGPLEVVRAGRTVPLGGRMSRALLALLLLEPNRVVP